MKKQVVPLLGACVALWAAEPAKYDYRVLATNKTSTMEKEMNEAADAGYVFYGVMGGGTFAGGKKVVVVMGKDVSRPTPARRNQFLGLMVG